MRSVKFYRRLADGTSRVLLGTACHYEAGWRFIPNNAVNKPSRKSHPTLRKCLPRWIGYPNHCESEESK
jgi:hypothetical protein